MRKVEEVEGSLKGEEIGLNREVDASLIFFQMTPLAEHGFWGFHELKQVIADMQIGCPRCTRAIGVIDQGIP